MTEQLTLDGSVPHPPPNPRRLRERQRDLMRYAWWHGHVTPTEARRYYRAPSSALGRLVALGLLDRAHRGYYVPHRDA